MRNASNWLRKTHYAENISLWDRTLRVRSSFRYNNWPAIPFLSKVSFSSVQISYFAFFLDIFKMRVSNTLDYLRFAAFFFLRIFSSFVALIWAVSCESRVFCINSSNGSWITSSRSISSRSVSETSNYCSWCRRTAALYSCRPTFWPRVFYTVENAWDFFSQFRDATNQSTGPITCWLAPLEKRICGRDFNKERSV